MAKSTYRQNAAEYRSLADGARCEKHRSLLLSIAREWEALADAADRRSKRYADSSALNSIAADHSNAPRREALAGSPELGSDDASELVAAIYRRWRARRAHGRGGLPEATSPSLGLRMLFDEKIVNPSDQNKYQRESSESAEEIANDLTGAAVHPGIQITAAVAEVGTKRKKIDQQSVPGRAPKTPLRLLSLSVN